jgi:large repetitive protein
VLGTPWSAGLVAAGGAAPYAWSADPGALPPGLALTPAGWLAGTPAAAGDFPLAVEVVDASGARASRAWTLRVAIAALAVSGAPLRACAVGWSCARAVPASGGVPPYAWAVTAGAAPAGLALDAATGVLAGTPTTAGTTTLSVHVSDAAGAAADAPVTLTVR